MPGVVSSGYTAFLFYPELAKQCLSDTFKNLVHMHTLIPTYT